MLDLNQIYDLGHDINGFYYNTASRIGKRYGFSENEHNRWLVKGRTLSGKTFFRHLCWDCFFKELRNTVDINRKARKGKWYAKLVNDNNVIPCASMSPSKEVFSLLFDITDEELEKERLKFATGTLESKIMRYGIEEGTRRWNEYRKRQAYTCSKEYMMNEKGMTKDEWKAYNANRASTKENFIKRYGIEEGIRRWDSYCAHESYAGSSLMWFINKLGKEAGTAEYARVCSEKTNLKSYSKISQKLFKEIDDALGDFALTSRWETKNYEYEIRVPSENKYISMIPTNVLSSALSSYGFDLQPIIYDILEDKNKANQLAFMKFRPDYFLNGKIIEFNGDFWHANPKIYNENDQLSMFGHEHNIAKNIWKRDAERIERFKLCGFKVHIVWESDYASDPEHVLEECVKFLKN